MSGEEHGRSPADAGSGHQPTASALRASQSGVLNAGGLRELIERFQHDGRPLPWVVHSGSSYRRIASVPTRDSGFHSFPDGNVLHGIIQRSDGHPDLSMPESELEALVEVINLLPAMADALEAASTTLAMHPGYAADVTFAAIWQWLEKRELALATIAKVFP